MRFITCLALALLTGCATVDITKTFKGFHDPTNANDVEVLYTKPSRAYQELGTVTATSFGINDTAKMHNGIRAKAAKLGAHAVFIQNEGIASDMYGSPVSRWSTGVVLRFSN
tara:strand:+ start:747 stop:1082 length:336 start_codon:yes stop_codon:yes gene_type:complete